MKERTLFTVKISFLIRVQNLRNKNAFDFFLDLFEKVLYVLSKFLCVSYRRFSTSYWEIHLFVPFRKCHSFLKYSKLFINFSYQFWIASMWFARPQIKNQWLKRRMYYLRNASLSSFSGSPRFRVNRLTKLRNSSKSNTPLPSTSTSLIISLTSESVGFWPMVLKRAVNSWKNKRM